MINHFWLLLVETSQKQPKVYKKRFEVYTFANFFVYIGNISMFNTLTFNTIVQ